MGRDEKTCEKTGRPETPDGGKPERCSPEQIKKCHGGTKGHSCCEKSEG